MPLVLPVCVCVYWKANQRSPQWPIVTTFRSSSSQRVKRTLLKWWTAGVSNLCEWTEASSGAKPVEGSELLEGQKLLEISNRNAGDRGLANRVQGKPSESKRTETDPAWNNMGTVSQTRWS